MHDRVSVVPPPSRRRLDLAVFFLLMALGAAIYWPIFAVRPLDGDNLYILWWAHTAPFGALLRLDPQIYPEWRPLAFQSIWLEHRLVPLSAVAIHHAINLLIWVSCTWLAYRIVFLLSFSRVAGMLAALLMLVDQRSVFTLLWIIERQTSLACFFGLLAIFLVVRAADRRLTRAEACVVALSLLASALSKEYGLSFSLALAAHAAWRRRRDLAWPAAIGPVLYVTLRLAIVGSATDGYCEDMGFFFQTEPHCIDLASAGSLAQMAYNVAASAVSIPLQGVFNDEGMIAISRARIAMTSVLLILAFAGFRKGPPETRLVALVVFFNAALSFLIYRERNLVLGVVAMAILAGSGIALWQPMRVVVLAVVIASIGRQTYETRILVREEVSEMLGHDPCESDVTGRTLGVEFANLVKTTYRLSPPCSKTD